MKIQALLDVYCKKLIDCYAKANGLTPDETNYRKAFEGEVAWLEQSGISLKSWKILSKTEEKIQINASFSIDENSLTDIPFDLEGNPEDEIQKENELKSALIDEFGWLEQSGICLKNIELEGELQ